MSINVNKPVENPKLSALLKEFNNCVDSKRRELQEKIAEELSMNANLLAMVHLDEDYVEHKEDHTAVFKADSHISFVMFQDANKISYLAVFTDWNEIYKNEELKNIFLKEYGINKPLIITAGLPFERKGIRDFIEIVEKCPDYQFIWFGSSSIKPMLPKKIQRIIDNPPKNLLFPGYVEKDILIGAFSAAKAFLFMTYEENEGIVVLEALSSRLPLVVRDIPVYDGWLSDGENCLKGRDNNEFYKKIVSVVNRKVKNIDEIIENGNKIAKDRDLVKIGMEYRRYYEEILKLEK